MTIPVETLAADWMKDPEFAAEYEKLRDEYELAAVLIDARKRRRVTQAQLAERMGVKQSAIARLESGKVAAKGETLRRYADALGYEVRLSLVPKRQGRAA